jgi:hypothetical protein
VLRDSPALSSSAPNAKMTDVPLVVALVERCWSARTRAGTSNGLTDHLRQRGVGF